MVGRAARHDVDPHASVAIGAALVGRALLTEANQTGTFTLSYEEMLSSAIGVAYNGSFDRVLDRGTRLPCEKSSSFKADAAGIKLSIYQGDSKVPAENEFLGKLILDVPPGTAVEVAFAVSGDGVLSVSAVSADGARRALKLATADTSDEGRAALAAASAPAQSPSPAPGPTAPTAPPPDEKKGLFKRLFGRK
jgi:molecular chaperone DnaK (HSP70)